MMDEKAFLFHTLLIEGIILKRKSQFTMVVDVKGEVFSCHCPTTGRIVNIEISSRPCLLSKSSDYNRKTPYTVEAFSLNLPDYSFYTNNNKN